MAGSSFELWIWGRHIVQEALESGHARVHELFSADSQPLPFAKNVSVKSISRDALTRKLDTDKHQGVAARITIEMWDQLSAWLEKHPTSGPLTFLGLDEIQDPQNFGALLRSAHFFGAQAALFTRDRSAPPTGIVAKASAGAMFHLGLIRATNLAREMDACEELGILRIGLDAEAPQELREVDIGDRHVLLLVGSEGEGLRHLTRKKCDQLVRLSGTGRRESLNASVAGGIGLYELFRLRNSRKTKS